MSPSVVFALAVCGFAAICSLPVANAQALVSPYESSAAADSQNGWGALGGLYALLAQHDALGGHALARKSVRSPSRRLRFGRRSDPDMPPQTPLDEMNELLSLREVRTPVRLRFGRRSEERAVPHIFPQEEQERAVRAPSMRLRFGRRSDNNMFLLPYEEQERAVRAPSMRLRFGRRSDNNMFLLPYESALPQEVKANGSVEDDRQQE